MLKVSAFDWSSMASTLGKNFLANKGLRNAGIGAVAGAATGALAAKDDNRLGGAVKGGLLGGAIGGAGSLISPNVIKSFTGAANGSTPAAAPGAPAARSFKAGPRQTIALKPASRNIAPLSKVTSPMPYTDAEIIHSTPTPLSASQSQLSGRPIQTIGMGPKQPVPVANVVPPAQFTPKPTPTLENKRVVLPAPKSTGHPRITPAPVRASAPDLAPKQSLSRQPSFLQSLLGKDTSQADIAKARYNFEGSPSKDYTVPTRPANGQLLRKFDK